MKSLLLPSVLLLCSSLLAQSAEHRGSAGVPMSVDEIEREAMANDPEIRAAERKVAVAQARSAGSGALEDPMGMYRNWGTPLQKPWDWKLSQQMFMYQQTLPGRGKRAARSEVANRQVTEAESQVDVVRREVSLRIRKAYYDLLRSADEHRLHDEQMQLANQALDSATIKYSVGRVPQQDVLKAQIAMTRLSEHVVMLDEQEEAARAELNSLMGRNPDADLEVTGTYGSARVLPSMAELAQIAVAHRPELKSMEASTNVAESQLALARKAYAPDVTVAGGYMLMPGGSQYRNNYMAEVTVNLPWLNRRKHESEIKEAETEVEVMKSEQSAERNAALLEIQQALIRARTVERRLKLYRDTLKPQAEAALRSASAAYQHDRADFLNLIDSQNVLLDVETSCFTAAADFDARIAELESAIGAPLPASPAAAAVAEVQ